ncbi:MAG: T9SS type A sorting domain-containing protein [Polaribacter sp.]|nr:T9SS type A sorting domain-containing protein [Polaribacter sp.]
MKKITLLLIFLLTILNSFSQVEIVTDFSWAFAKKVNNRIVFSHNTADYGKELWVSDGTTEGTVLLKDINPGTGDSTPFHFTLLDDVVYFQANTHQIWRTDGTIGGTYLMVNNNQITNPYGFVKTKNFIFFTEGASGSGCCRTLWKMNVNANSESIVTPLENFTTVRDLNVFNYSSDDILFNAQTSSNGWAIWRSNGGVSLLVKDLYTEYSDGVQMGIAKKFGDDLYFSGFTPALGAELWKTDGTLSNTNLVKDIYSDNTLWEKSSGVNNFIKVGATIYFTAKDIIHGYELWKTDGSEAGTQLIKDIYPGNNNNSPPSNLTEFNNQLYFVQSDGVSRQVWKTDGTEVGTIKVSNIPNGYFEGNSTAMFAFNNVLYFSYYHPDFGVELWKLDANDNLTIIQDINIGTGGSSPFEIFEYNGYIYFSAYTNNTYGSLKTFRIIDQSLTAENFNKSDTISIYPNPTSDFINIKMEKYSYFNTEIYNVLGKKVGNYKNQKSIDISHLTSGIYQVKIMDLKTNTFSSYKIIKN